MALNRQIMVTDGIWIDPDEVVALRRNGDTSVTLLMVGGHEQGVQLKNLTAAGKVVFEEISKKLGIKDD